MTQMWSVGFTSGFHAGQGNAVMVSFCMKSVTTLEQWGLALSSRYTSLREVGGCQNVEHHHDLKYPCSTFHLSHYPEQWQSEAYNLNRQTRIITDPSPNGTDSLMFLHVSAVWGGHQTRVLTSVTCRINQLSSDHWIFLQNARFRCWHCSTTPCKLLCVLVWEKGVLSGLLAFSPAARSCFRTTLLNNL